MWSYLFREYQYFYRETTKSSIFFGNHNQKTYIYEQPNNLKNKTGIKYNSAYEINESLQKGESPETLDVVDLSVGLVGLGSTTLVAVGIISNPIGWGIGLGVTIYGAGRLAYDLFWKEN